MLSKWLFLLTISICLPSCIATQKRETSGNTSVAELAQAQRFMLSDGLHVRLTPASGFTLTPEHYGFVQAESFSRIKVYEVEVPYQEYLLGFSQESLAQQKMQLIKNKAVQLQNAVCNLISVKQAIAGTVFDKEMLICGDELSSVVVEASYPESATTAHKQAIYHSITSLSVKTDKQLRLFTGLPFELTDTPDYKITTRFRNSLVMQPLSDSSGKSTLVISHGVSEGTTTQQLAAHLIKKDSSPEDIKILTNEQTALNNITALATTAHVNIEGDTYYMKQILSYQNDRFLLVQTRVPIAAKAGTNRTLNSLLEHFVFKQ